MVVLLTVLAAPFAPHLAAAPVLFGITHLDTLGCAGATLLT